MDENENKKRNATPAGEARPDETQTGEALTDEAVEAVAGGDVFDEVRDILSQYM